MKDSFWFRHDSNAADDPKCILLIDQLGMEGYGIFWILIEKLREQPEYTYPLKLIPALAKRYATSTEKMLTVIKNFDLFSIQNDDFFYSKSLTERMKLYSDKKNIYSERAQKAALSRWKNNTSNAQAMLNECSIMLSDANRIDKNIIYKNRLKRNIKEKNAFFSPPSIDDLTEYFRVKIIENNYTNDALKEAKKFESFYSSKNWMVGKNKMTDWKKAVSGWLLRDNSSQEEKTGLNKRVNIFD